MSIDSPPLTAALKYAERDWQVFPCWDTDGPTCRCRKGADCPDAGKHPVGDLVPHGHLDATTDADTIRRWWTERPTANVAIRCGSASGLWVLDRDDRNGGDVSLEKLEAQHGRLPYSLRVRSGSHAGEHILFAYPNHGRRVGSAKGELGPGLDIKGEGGYIVAPPSSHRSGHQYEWLDEDDSKLEEAPEWLLEKLCASRPTDHSAAIPVGVLLPPREAGDCAQRWYDRALEKVAAGESRHNTFLWFASLCRDDGVPVGITESYVPPFKRVCDRRADRVVEEAELFRVVRDVYAAQRRTPSEYAKAKLREVEQEGPDGSASMPRLISPADLLTEHLDRGTTTLPLPWPTLSQALGGGLETRRNHVVVGPAGAGKTAFLVQAAAHAAKLDVCYALLALRDGDQWSDGLRLTQLEGVDRFGLRDRDSGQLLRAEEILGHYQERLMFYDVTAKGACIADMIQKGLAWAAGRGPLLVCIDSIHVMPYSSQPREASLGLYDRIGYRLESLHADLVKHDVVALTTAQAGRASYRARQDGQNVEELAAISGGHVAENTVDVLLSVGKANCGGIQQLSIPKSRLGGQGSRILFVYDPIRSRWTEAEMTQQPKGESPAESRSAARKTAKNEAERKRRESLRRYLEGHPEGGTAKDIAKAVDRPRNWVSDVMTELREQGRIESVEVERRDAKGRAIRVPVWRWKDLGS